MANLLRFVLGRNDIKSFQFQLFQVNNQFLISVIYSKYKTAVYLMPVMTENGLSLKFSIKTCNLQVFTTIYNPLLNSQLLSYGRCFVCVI